MRARKFRGRFKGASCRFSGFHEHFRVSQANVRCHGTSVLFQGISRGFSEFQGMSGVSEGSRGFIFQGDFKEISVGFTKTHEISGAFYGHFRDVLKGLRRLQGISS